MNEENLHFALDIGTRSIVGIVLKEDGDNYTIIASEVTEHNTRAMVDGQIHDIPAVTKTVKEVIVNLEKKIDTQLTDVAIAAAGRTLYTKKALATKEIPFGGIIDKVLLNELITVGVQQAQALVSNNDAKGTDYYCVGYSIIKYLLDDLEIKNPLGQRGQEIQAEIIATFLPKLVVDSLNSVIKNAGLKVKSMTLEPIAASQVVISEGIRKLNLALIDIGAGTSDIAISREGFITGFAMVSSAGDTITDIISENLLVDFLTAEIIKKQLVHQDEVSYTDILGFKHTIPSADIIENLSPQVELLAKKIAHEIISLNGKPPQAVILIGGGSLTPRLDEMLSARLGLPSNRVAVRGREVITNVKGDAQKITGPMAITPIGIALTQIADVRNSFEYVTLNGEIVRLFATEKLKLLDALLAAGISNTMIFPRPGDGMTVEVNGKLLLIKGTEGTPAKVKLNNKEASLDNSISCGDEIHFEPSIPGDKPSVLLKDCLPADLEKTIYLNGQKRYIKPIITINGQRKGLYSRLGDKAIVYYKNIDTVAKLLQYLGIEYTDEEIFINEQAAIPKSLIKDQDTIIIGKNKKNLSSIQVIVNGKIIKLHGKKSYLLLDIFDAIDFEAVPPKDKKRLILRLNEKDASYTSILENKDKVEILWD